MRLQPFGYVQRHPHSVDGVGRWVDIYALGVCESDLAVDIGCLCRLADDLLDTKKKGRGQDGLSFSHYGHSSSHLIHCRNKPIYP